MISKKIVCVWEGIKVKRLGIGLVVTFYLLTVASCPVQAATGISITEVTSLDFGRVYMGSPEQDVSPVSSKAAQILVEVDTNQQLNYEVQVGYLWGFLNFTVINNQEGNGSLLVTNLRSSLENDTGTIEGGQDTFGIGGTLQQVPSDIEGGQYQGSMSLTITLNS